MALIICDECNKEFSDTLTACPHCGKKIITESDGCVQKIKINIKHMSRKQMIFVASVCVILCVVILSGVMTSKNERIAIQNCKDLKSMLNNPNSLQIYDDIEILRVYDAETNDITRAYMYISYGAENGYGGMGKGIAAFDENGFICDMAEDNEEDDFTSKERYKAFLYAKSEISAYSLIGDEKTDGFPSYYKLETIPSEKISKKLRLD